MPIPAKRSITPTINSCTSRLIVMRVHGDTDVTLSARDVIHYGTID